jgi:predicted TPR repeat methyltransferase
MTEHSDAGASAKEAYDAFAGAYEAFNKGYMYERWTATLLSAAEEAGLAGTRLLDVACGTGLSFIPMLERGWEVTACDISPAMLEIARVKPGVENVALTVADMSALPQLGEADLVWALNDALNYLHDRTELEATLAGMRRNLASRGFIVFDVNTLRTYRTFFSTERIVEADGRRFVWRGKMTADSVVPNLKAEAVFEE